MECGLEGLFLRRASVANHSYFACYMYGKALGYSWFCEEGIAECPD